MDKLSVWIFCVFMNLSAWFRIVQGQDDAWRQRLEYEYYFSPATNKVTWSQARQYCLDAGADLVSVHSQSEHNWIRNNKRYADYWMGMRNPQALGRDDANWKWSDGSPRNWIKWEGHYFDTDEPNNRGNACGFYDSDSFDDWYDTSCSAEKRFICKREEDDCASDSCTYHGECHDGPNSYTCTCHQGYTGSSCQTEIDECATEPCENGGTCHDEIGYYTCQCSQAFEGERCQLDTDECSMSEHVCHNNGTCNNTHGGFLCICAPGFEGPLCQTDIDECSSSPCENSGRCEDGIGTFTCSCGPGFSGAFCEKQRAGAGAGSVWMIAGIVAALLFLVFLVLLVILACRCNRRRKKQTKGSELSTLADGADSGRGYTRNESHVSVTENEVYERSPLNSPERYPHGGVLYTAPNKERANGSDAKVKFITDSKDSNALYEKEQPVFNFDREQIATYSEQNGSKERLVSDSSLYSKEEPVTKVRIPSDNSLYAKEHPIDDPSSTYYSTPIPVVKPVIEYPTSGSPNSQKSNSLYSKEKPVLQPPLGGVQSGYAREHYRSYPSESGDHDPTRSSTGDAIYVNQIGAASTQNAPPIDYVTDTAPGYDTYSLGTDLKDDSNDATGDVTEADVNGDGHEPVVYTYADHNFTPSGTRTTSHPDSTLSHQGSLSTGEYSPTYLPMGSTKSLSLRSQGEDIVYANFNPNATESQT